MNKNENKALSLRGDAGDVAISCDKALSLRGGLMSDEAIFQAVLKAVRRLLSRCCKNVEDCRVSAMHFLAMTPSTLILAAILNFANISESRAECTDGTYACGSSCISNGQDCYMYDDNGRLKEILSSNFSANGGITRTVLNYEGDNLVGGMQYYQNRDIDGSLSSPVSISELTDGTYYLTPDTSAGGHSLILDSDKKNILNDGYRSRDTNEDLQGNSYAYTDGHKSSRTSGVVCEIDGVSSHGVFYSHCQNTPGSTTQDYTYITDEDGNIIAEKIGGETVATHSYTEAYLANQKTQKDAQCTAAGNCTSCYSGLLQGGKCVSTCGSSFKENDGECDRIRYTPAEAAQYLKDTDNTIIMTFKVNR